MLTISLRCFLSGMVVLILAAMLVACSNDDTDAPSLDVDRFAAVDTQLQIFLEDNAGFTGVSSALQLAEKGYIRDDRKVADVVFELVHLMRDGTSVPNDIKFSLHPT